MSGMKSRQVVRVTQEMIDRGVCDHTFNCAIALAAAHLFNTQKVEVLTLSTAVEADGKIVTYDHGEELTAWIKLFDFDRRLVSPILVYYDRNGFDAGIVKE